MRSLSLATMVLAGAASYAVAQQDSMSQPSSSRTRLSRTTEAAAMATDEGSADDGDVVTFVSQLYPSASINPSQVRSRPTLPPILSTSFSCPMSRLPPIHQSSLH